MAKKRKNGEGTWGKKTIRGIAYIFYRDASGQYFYGKTEKDVKAKIKQVKSETRTVSGKAKPQLSESICYRGLNQSRQE